MPPHSIVWIVCIPLLFTVRRSAFVHLLFGTNLFTNAFCCNIFVLFSFHQSQSLFNRKNFCARNGLFAPKIFIYTVVVFHLSAASANATVNCRCHFELGVCVCVQKCTHTTTQIMKTLEIKYVFACVRWNIRLINVKLVKTEWKIWFEEIVLFVAISQSFSVSISISVFSFTAIVQI